MKRLFFGLFAAAIAIGGSAYTNAAPTNGRFAVYTFVHPAYNAVNTRLQFIYDPTPGGCYAASGTCSAQWSQLTAPNAGANPATNATLDVSSVVDGNYSPQ